MGLCGRHCAAVYESARSTLYWGKPAGDCPRRCEGLPHRHIGLAPVECDELPGRDICCHEPDLRAGPGSVWKQARSEVGQEGGIASTPRQQTGQSSHDVDPASYGGPRQAVLGKTRPGQGRQGGWIAAEALSQWSLPAAGACGGDFVELTDDLSDTDPSPQQRSQLRPGGSALDHFGLAHIPAQGPLQLLKGITERFGSQHHAWTTTERSIVDHTMRVVGVVPEVDEVDPEVALSLSYPEDALVQVGPDGLRKEGQDCAAQGALPRRKGEQTRGRPGKGQVGW